MFKKDWLLKVPQFWYFYFFPKLQIKFSPVIQENAMLKFTFLVGRK